MVTFVFIVIAYGSFIVMAAHHCNIGATLIFGAMATVASGLFLADYHSIAELIVLAMWAWWLVRMAFRFVRRG